MSEQGESFDVLRAGKTVYVRGSRAFYTKVAGKQAAALLQGKWLSAPATTGQFASIGELTDIKTFFTGVLGSHGTVTKGAETTIGGQKVIGLVDHSSSGGTLYIATTGKPYPIEIASPHGGASGAVHFTGWGTSIRIAAPKSVDRPDEAEVREVAARPSAAATRRRAGRRPSRTRAIPARPRRGWR